MCKIFVGMHRRLKQIRIIQRLIHHLMEDIITSKKSPLCLRVFPNLKTNDKSFLSELGIDIPGIIKKSKAILFFQLKSPDLEDLDMGGPLLIAAALGAIHLIVKPFQAHSTSHPFRWGNFISESFSDGASVQLVFSPLW